MVKAANVIFLLGFVLCSLFMTFDASTVDYTLTVRTLIWGVTTLILFLMVAFRFKEIDLSVLKNPIFFTFGIYGLITAYSICVSTYYWEVIYNALRISVMISYLFLAIVFLKDSKWFPRILILVTIVMGAYSLYEFFTISNVGLRRGLMGNKNQCASAFFLLMILCLHYWKKWRILSSLAVAFCLFAIVTLRARATWLAVCVSVIAFGFIYRKYLLTTALILLIAGGIVYGNYRYSILNTTSLNQRLDVWRQTLRMIKDNPLGVGAGNWKIEYQAYSKYLAPSVRILTYRNNFFGRAHNDLMQICAEVGIFGFIAYLSLFLLALYYSKGMIRIGILGYMVIAYFTFPNERPFHSMILMLFFAHAILQRHRPSTIRLKYIRPVFAVTCILLFLAVADFYHRDSVSRQTQKIYRAVYAKDWHYVIAQDIPKINNIDISSTPLNLYKGIAYINLANQDLIYYKQNEKILSEAPKLVSLQQRNKSLVASAKYKYENAITVLEDAMKSNPNHLFLLMSLANTYRILQMDEKAYFIFKAAWEMFPDCKEAYEGYLYSLKKYQEKKWRQTNSHG